MKRIFLMIAIVFALAMPVSALDITAPTVPEAGSAYMPKDTESFGEGLWFVIKSAVAELQPSVAQACAVCLSLVAITMLVSILRDLSGLSKRITQLVGALMIALVLLRPLNTLIHLGADTVSSLSQYSKLFLPVMTAALAASGGTSTSASLYTATAFFSSLLSSAIAKLIIPMLYIYLCLAVADSATGESLLADLKGFVKWLMTWCLKIILYVFTGYVSVTGIISGSVDASAVKATKIAISGSVPVVGSIISDASETILVSAGIMKNAAGVYGLLAILALCVGPFFQTGVQYIILKLTCGVCGIFDKKQSGKLVQDFSGAMGMILAMIGTQCVLLLVSTVCFMKGVG